MNILMNEVLIYAVKEFLIKTFLVNLRKTSLVNIIILTKEPRDIM